MTVAIRDGWGWTRREGGHRPPGNGTAHRERLTRRSPAKRATAAGARGRSRRTIDAVNA